MIVAREIGRYFQSTSGETVHALDGLDLDLPSGAFVVICGPSGCGKSTLLNLIGLLDKPSRGHLVVSGVEVSQLDRTAAAAFRLANVGFLFQDAGLLEPMRVDENVLQPLIYRRIWQSERTMLVERALDAVGLAHRSLSHVRELSGGERQRVGLARAIVSRPTILVCDEPTAALDAASSTAIAELLSEQARGGTSVICSSHDPLLIERADLLVRLEHGRLLGSA